mmetsp:Transcript_420/g.840  ORF Transcript_420/g.840 Transcript_420/m.840 type:complete len:201 (-) Transcript_420:1-603(-)
MFLDHLHDELAHPEGPQFGPYFGIRRQIRYCDDAVLGHGVRLLAERFQSLCYELPGPHPEQPAPGLLAGGAVGNSCQPVLGNAGRGDMSGLDNSQEHLTGLERAVCAELRRVAPQLLCQHGCIHGLLQQQRDLVADVRHRAGCRRCLCVLHIDLAPLRHRNGPALPPPLLLLVVLSRHHARSFRLCRDRLEVIERTYSTP